MDENDQAWVIEKIEEIREEIPSTDAPLEEVVEQIEKADKKINEVIEEIKER